MTDDDLSSPMTNVQRSFYLVVQTALIVLNAPPTTIFLYENINTSQKLAKITRELEQTN